MKYCIGILPHGAVKYGFGLPWVRCTLGGPIARTYGIVRRMESKLSVDSH